MNAKCSVLTFNTGSSEDGDREWALHTTAYGGVLCMDLFSSHIENDTVSENIWDPIKDKPIIVCN